MNQDSLGVRAKIGLGCTLGSWLLAAVAIALVAMSNSFDLIVLSLFLVFVGVLAGLIGLILSAIVSFRLRHEKASRERKVAFWGLLLSIPGLLAGGGLLSFSALILKEWATHLGAVH